MNPMLNIGQTSCSLRSTLRSIRITTQRSRITFNRKFGHSFNRKIRNLFVWFIFESIKFNRKWINLLISLMAHNSSSGDHIPKMFSFGSTLFTIVIYQFTKYQDSLKHPVVVWVRETEHLSSISMVTYFCFPAVFRIFIFYVVSFFFLQIFGQLHLFHFI